MSLRPDILLYFLHLLTSSSWFFQDDRPGLPRSKSRARDRERLQRRKNLYDKYYIGTHDRHHPKTIKVDLLIFFTKKTNNNT